MTSLNYTCFPQDRTFAIFPESDQSSLSNVCNDFYRSQVQTWPECRQGFEALTHCLHRSIQCTGFSVIIQHNPARAMSTSACVGEKDIADRPCFLCSHRLPPNQKAIFYREGYVILCNPMPVFPLHLTIAHRIHQPQELRIHLSDYIQLIEDFGHHWVILYNGPRCGASAPDHLHFQAAVAEHMPIERQINENGRLALIGQNYNVLIYRANNMGRAAIVLEGNNPSQVTEVLLSLLLHLNIQTGQMGHKEEPMVNLIGTLHEGKIRLIVFPRLVHRPRAFYSLGKDKIMVSPAVAEMGGIIVTPVMHDFERMEKNTIEEIYQEVSFSPLMIEALIRDITAFV